MLLRVDKAPANPGRTILSVDHLGYKDNSGIHRLKDVSFEVHSGEIVGVAGVPETVNREILDIITGINPLQNGK
ncbi:MAG: hypothetical protein CM1200mP28_06280 [Deltaproteobacteria bacterium]|nr:MAG: hypothetical protein CM1200mP28_06280 [Deltaproteobacteria bacterium]